MRSGPGGVASNGRAHHAYGEGSSVVLVGIKCGSGCGCRVYEIMMLSAWDALWDPADNPVPYCRVYAVDSPQIRSDIKDQSARKKHVCILLYNVHIVIRTVLRSQYHSVHSVQTPLDVRFYTTDGLPRSCVEIVFFFCFVFTWEHSTSWAPGVQGACPLVRNWSNTRAKRKENSE